MLKAYCRRGEAVRYWTPSTSQVCCAEGLFRAASPGLGDRVESVFFDELDRLAAAACRRLISIGPAKMSAKERSDFVRLLLSLEARRPEIVGRLRGEGAEHYRANLNTPELQERITRHGIVGSPADYFETVTGASLGDNAMLIVQRLSDTKRVGQKIMDAKWAIRRIADGAGRLVLSDRPLIRGGSFDSPRAHWALPINPQHAFIACADPRDLATLMARSDAQFARAMNVSSAMQADRYVFSLGETNTRWLENWLPLPEVTGKSY